MLWSAPVQIGFALWGLWSQVGVALLAGLGVMVVLFPLTVWFTARVTDAQSDLMERRDARVKLSSEMVSHMQFVKMSAWEQCFGDLIGRARQFELAALWRYGLFQMGQSLFWTGMPIMVSLATFACFALLGREELTPSRAFTALSLFNILQFPLSVLPYVISDVVQAVVSLRRLSSFLLAAELQLDNITYYRSAAACRAGQTAVEIEQASYFWDDDMHLQALADITLSVPCSQHVCIVGRTVRLSQSFSLTRNHSTSCGTVFTGRWQECTDVGHSGRSAQVLRYTIDARSHCLL
jgi:ATP-binding cassette subfamily C (CFTR/MRP) protein 1